MGPKKQAHGKTSLLGTEGMPVHFRFQKADPNRFRMRDFAANGIDCLLKTLAEAETVTWAEFRKRKDYRCHPIKRVSFNHELPDYVSDDETILSLDVLGHHPARLYGYRSGQYFYIVWFDVHHDAIPM